MAIYFHAIKDGYTGNSVLAGSATEASAVPVLNQYGEQRVVVDVNGQSISSTNPLPMTDALATAANSSSWQTSVTNSATKAKATPTSFVNGFVVCNNSGTSVFLGFSSGVTTSTGIEVISGSYFSVNVADASTVYLISASATLTISFAGN